MQERNTNEGNYRRNSPYNVWILPLIAAITTAIRMSPLALGGVRTHAIIKEIVTEKIEEFKDKVAGLQGTEYNRYIATFSFKDKKGEIFEFSSSYETDNQTASIGTRVEIIYDPSNPTFAVVYSFSNLWGGFLLMLFFALVLLIPAALILKYENTDTHLTGSQSASLVVALFVLGAILISSGITYYKSTASKENWPAVKGELVSAQIEAIDTVHESSSTETEPSGYNSKRSYTKRTIEHIKVWTWVVKYKFFVDGKEIIGSNATSTPVEQKYRASTDTIEPWLSKYKSRLFSNSKIDVHVNPKNSGENYLIFISDKTFIAKIAGGTFLVLLGFIALILALTQPSRTVKTQEELMQKLESVNDKNTDSYKAIMELLSDEKLNSDK